MRTGRNSLWMIALALLGGSALWLAGADPRPSEADEAGEARLLLKCPQSEVPQLLQLLHGHVGQGNKVEVWDLKTMRPLSVAPAEKGAPALGDATRLMGNIFSLVDALGPESSGRPALISEMTVQSRRAVFRLLFHDVATSDKVRKALMGHPWMREHVQEVAPGALQRLKQGGFKMSFALRLKQAEPGAVPTEPVPFLEATALEKASLAANMQMVYASALARDPNPQGGFETRSREFTFSPSTLTQFRTLLQGLAALHDQAVVYELRWKLADEKVRAEQPDAIGKSVVRVGMRSGLADK